MPRRDSENPRGLTSIGPTIAIRGEVTAGEHLIIEGSVRGKVSAPRHGVAIARQASVAADISARTITVLGKTSGRLSASDTLHVESGAVIEGNVEAREVTLANGAHVRSGDGEDTERAFADTRSLRRRSSAPAELPTRPRGRASAPPRRTTRE